MPLDGDQLLEMFVRTAVGGRGRKRAKRAQAFLGGQGGFLTASAVMAAVGVAWGLYDSLRSQAAVVPAGGVPPASGVSVPPSAAAPATAPPLVVPPNVARVVALAVSAAGADGAMSEVERQELLRQAAAAGVDVPAADALQVRQPLSEIVRGVDSAAERQDLYVLAYTIVRADDGVSGAERIYLAQLAHALGLDAATAAALERQTGDAIDRAGPAPA